MTALTMSMICALCGIIGYCIAQIILCIINRSDERTEQRRAMYRERAYKQMNERWSLMQRRRALWRWIEK